MSADRPRVDLRSDTVTRPTPEMRAAMAEAVVGDDVLGDDPTVHRLEAAAAERMGKEAAVFLPSGTMGNLAAILSHCGRGDEAIVGAENHCVVYEAGGMAALGGVHNKQLANRKDGSLDPAEVEAAVRADDAHFPPSRLVCLENSHNRAGGRCTGPAYLAEIRAIADRHDLAIHIDGARLFNAAVAQGLPAADLVADADSVTFCLSKGLSAPVGSVLCGSRAFIGRARRLRKMLGGGMRQAGVLAAAGLVALETMVERLAEDHANARRLAEGLAALPAVVIEPDEVETNIVLFGLREDAPLDARGLIGAMAERGVAFFPVGGGRMRLVTHHDVSAEGVEEALAGFEALLGG